MSDQQATTNFPNSGTQPQRWGVTYTDVLWLLKIGHRSGCKHVDSTNFTTAETCSINENVDEFVTLILSLGSAPRKMK